MERLESWCNRHVVEYDSLPVSEIYQTLFHRDDNRATIDNDKVFYSPSDGVFLYQNFVSLNDELIDIKGTKLTLEELLQDEEAIELIKKQEKYGKCYIGVNFMTFYDIHLLRVPSEGLTYFKHLDSMVTRNRPSMELTENKIFDDLLDKYDIYEDMDYLYKNERVLTTFKCPSLDHTYFVVAIADDFINVIAHFFEQGKQLMQGVRYAIVRWGSCTVTIIPPHNKWMFKNIMENPQTTKQYFHIMAGVDPIVSIEEKDARKPD